MNAPLVLRDGGEVEVLGDITGDEEPIAILYVKTVFEFCGETIVFPGVEFEPPHGTPVVVRANVTLGTEDAKRVAAALLQMTAPLTDEEIRKLRAGEPV